MGPDIIPMASKLTLALVQPLDYTRYEGRRLDLQRPRVRQGRGSGSRERGSVPVIVKI
ncbi:MAG: hypothetical protein LBU79_05405 [Planctomycetota bacterium]|nr:hypothetical protein [Planctomycetota bacterium]